VRALLGFRGRVGQPSWSPRGGLAFTLFGAAPRTRLGVAQPRGDCVRLLGRGRDPAWQPGAAARLVQLCPFMTVGYRSPTDTLKGTVRVPSYINRAADVRAYGDRGERRRTVRVVEVGGGPVVRRLTGAVGNWRAKGFQRRGVFSARASAAVFTPEPGVRVVCAPGRSHVFRLPVVQRRPEQTPPAVLHIPGERQRAGRGTYTWAYPPGPDGLTASVVADTFCLCAWPATRAVPARARARIVWRRRQRPRDVDMTYWRRIDNGRGNPVGPSRRIHGSLHRTHKGFYEVRFRVPRGAGNVYLYARAEWAYRPDAGGGEGDYFVALRVAT
jgi:hypothetical protein